MKGQEMWVFRGLGAAGRAVQRHYSAEPASVKLAKRKRQVAAAPAPDLPGSVVVARTDARLRMLDHDIVGDGQRTTSLTVW